MTQTQGRALGAGLLRRPLLFRTLCETLRDAREPIPAAEALQRVAERVELNPHELERYERGQQRFSVFLRFASSWAKPIGWINKGAGEWSITDAGLQAMQEYTPEELFKRLGHLYRQDLNRRRGEKGGGSRRDRVIQALDFVDEGRWTTSEDLGRSLGIDPTAVARYVDEAEDESRHRLLRPDGTVLPEFRWADPDSTESPRQVLEREGVAFDGEGRADPTQRLTAEDLRDLLEQAGLLGAQMKHAWLVRGSSVAGYNLVPQWLEEGWVSLAATNLSPVEDGIDRQELKQIVESDYSAKSYAARQDKLNELHAFLSRMRLGDLVATTTGGDVYLGVVTGVAEQVDSPGRRSNLRRTVEWKNPDRAVPFSELPNPLPAKLSSQLDVVDLTESLALLEELIGEEPPPGPVSREVVLRAATPELARELFVGVDWLDEVIRVLADRRQLIFYGPPGTGKTYLAQHLARHLTEPQAVKLVQFHPSYAYEDFFEGFRPTPSDDGRVGFELRPGPFRRLVEAARQDSTTPYVLIVDEINRANLAKVFGELYFLLEYRDQSIGLLYSAGEEEDFTLPPNVFLLGTMNSADRSIALVDSAMRRRFAFVSLHPAEDHVKHKLRGWLTAHGHSDEAARLLDELNRRIVDRDFAIGPSNFMREDVYRPGGLERVWRTAIMPLLEELHYGEEIDLDKEYGLETLRAALAERQSEPEPAEEPSEL